jgi:hypothetical protein
MTPGSKVKRRRIQLPKTSVRLPTGIGKTTVPFYTDDFCGDPADYDFKRQTKNYVALRDALARLNLKLDVLGARIIEGDRAQFTAYVGDPKAPLIIWEKFETTSPISGANRLFIRGEKIPMTSFVSMTPEEQELLIEPCELRRLMRKTLTTEERKEHERRQVGQAHISHRSSH